MNNKNQTKSIPKQVHTIIGAGQVGQKLARLLVAAGFETRLIRKSATNPNFPGVRFFSGDIVDVEFAAQAC